MVRPEGDEPEPVPGMFIEYGVLPAGFRAEVKHAVEGRVRAGIADVAEAERLAITHSAGPPIDNGISLVAYGDEVVFVLWRQAAMHIGHRLSLDLPSS
eukprot:7389616-Pyramimonas_sp.AAC.1